MQISNTLLSFFLFRFDSGHVQELLTVIFFFFFFFFTSPEPLSITDHSNPILNKPHRLISM